MLIWHMPRQHAEYSVLVTITLENFIHTSSILKTIWIGSNHVDPITATSEYAEVASIPYITYIIYL
jgi:hypothetical protein